MTHENRGRLTVDPDGNWRLYTNSIPAGCTVLGTVTRDVGETGALVLTNAGIYSMLNERVYRGLDQRKVRAALGMPDAPVGRPQEMAEGGRRNIYISNADWQRAQEIGGGNASKGIQIALAAFAATPAIDWIELDVALCGAGIDAQDFADRTGLLVIEDADAATAGGARWGRLLVRRKG